MVYAKFGGQTKIKVYYGEFENRELVPEIFKLEKCVKYENERTDDVIHSTQYNLKYVNGAISINSQQRPLKLMARHLLVG